MGQTAQKRSLLTCHFARCGSVVDAGLPKVCLAEPYGKERKTLQQHGNYLWTKKRKSRYSAREF
jgi:hypothetical protein